MGSNDNMDQLVQAYLAAEERDFEARQDATVAEVLLMGATRALKGAICRPVEGSDDPGDISDDQVRAWVAAWKDARMPAEVA